MLTHAERNVSKQNLLGKEFDNAYNTYQIYIQESILRNDLKCEKNIIHEDACYGFIYNSEKVEIN